MQIYHSLTVDVAKRNQFKAVSAKQLDCNSRFLKIELQNNGSAFDIPNNATIAMAVERNGETKAFNCTYEDNYIIAPLDTWILQESGYVDCEIILLDTETNSKLSSFLFSLEIEQNIYNDENIKSDENYDLLLSLIGDVKSSQIVSITEKVNGLKHTYTVLFGSGESKEFVISDGAKGDKGDPGTPGKDGAPGKDGYTPIKGVDYFDGADGKNATINGKNAINILAGDNINLEENGDDIQISASNQKQIATNENDITDITEIVIDDVDNPLIIDNEITNVSNGIASSQAVYNLAQETENNMIKAPTVQGTAGQILGLDENSLPIWLNYENKKYIKLIDDLTIDNDITRIFSYTQFKDGSPLGNLSEIIIFTNAVKTDTIRKFGITFNDEYTSSAYQWNIFDWQYGFSETQSSGFFYCNLKNGINLSGGRNGSSSYAYYDMYFQNRISTYEKEIEKLTFGLGWGNFLSGSNFKIYAR